MRAAILLIFTACAASGSSVAHAPLAPESRIEATPAPSGATSQKARRAQTGTAHGTCPCVSSACTIDDVPDGVKITIAIAGVPDAAERAAAYARRAAEPKRHDGSGGGHGHDGDVRCPLVIKDTRIEVEAHEREVIAIVHAQSSREVDWLRREARERLESALRAKR